MSDLIIVQGSDCLNYIDTDIGFCDTNKGIGYDELEQQLFSGYTMTIKDGAIGTLGFGGSFYAYCHIIKWANNKNKRIVGVLRKQYDDGGLWVDVYSEPQIFENFKQWRQVTENYTFLPFYNNDGHYDRDVSNFNFYPAYTRDHISGQDQYGCVEYPSEVLPDGIIPFDEVIDYSPNSRIDESTYNFGLEPTITFNEGNTSHNITKTEPLIFGHGREDVYNFSMVYWNRGNPLNYCAGDLYSAICDFTRELYASVPASFTNIQQLADYEKDMGVLVGSYNLAGIPFNLIITESKEMAMNYLDNGVLPSDAFLYPLDWNNLPQYDGGTPTSDVPEDLPDDDIPDDIDRDFDPNLPEDVSFTVNQLTNYNWYWLTVPEWSEFIRWFWQDIGDFNDFDDLIAKVKGLYNDVASAVIMCRYYPVDYEWITGISLQNAPTDKLRLGMIEKASGTFTTISQEHSLHAVDIGHIKIDNKYNSFMDMSPYSQLSLYLPWHGFIDLDINLFSGHELWIKALYDYLSGTIQYYVYYDNEVLVNTILCKMAMDIPITLQTKNDRDSAIFSNVSSTIGGLVGAGAGIVSGNPIGMTLGITQGIGALNSGNNSAPMRFMGNVGETGGYVAPQYCYIVVRRPTIQPSDADKTLTTWKRNVGKLCGYGYKLSNLADKNCGFTVCDSPRIEFKNSTPLQSEVEEIYTYLSEGVIL